jgi:DNA processing protein
MPDDRLDILRLVLTRRVGLLAYRRMVDAFGSLSGALAAPLDRLAAVRGVGRDTAAAIHVVRREQAEIEEQRVERMGGRIVLVGDPDYPAALRNIHDPPLALYVLGEIRPAEKAVAIVGARRATPYGRRMAEAIARGLAEAGVAVVSGLARGIDAAAHRGALAGSGRTIAVLGNGLNRCYPEEHEPLFRAIAEGGAVVSEFPLDTQPFPHHFPRRNRIVSGLALAVCVVEAAQRSGSLITAEWALEQGREVFAVPQRVDDPGAAGVHRLLRDGAGLVESADDIIFALGLGWRRPAELAPASASGTDETPMGLSEVERRVFELLGSDPRPIDELIEEAALPASTVFATLTRLELKRVARGWPGRMYQRAATS